MLLVPESRLRTICRSIVLAMRATPATANIMAEALVSANLEGMDSHGVLRLPRYVQMMEEGQIVPRARPEVVHKRKGIALLDGHWCFGQVAGLVAARQVVRSARAHAIGAVGLFHVMHVGRLIEYVRYVGEHGMVAIALCNAGWKSVVPFRGSSRVFGTNPMAFAVPRQGGRVLIADFATSVMAEGKVRVALQSQQPLPDGVIINKDGYPTTDVKEFYAGGALLPFGAHKGYALSLFIDIVGGLLVGAGSASMTERSQGNGLLLIALDVAAFRAADEFTGAVEELLGIVKATPSAPGQPPVLLPGEPEVMAREKRSREGIPIDDETWAALKATGLKLGVSVDLFRL